MTLHSAVAAELPFLQREAEALMIDTCTVRYATGRMIQDETTGAEVPEYAVRLTSKCKVQARSLVVRGSEGGGREVVSVRLELHLPVSTTPLEVGDVAEITATGAGSSTQVGRMLRIAGPVDKTFATAYRYEVSEVVA